MNKSKFPNPKTFDEQLKILKNEHNLIIDDNTFNQQILKNVNYYVLKNYADSVGYISKIAAGKNYKYVKNVKLWDIYNLYLFDIKLKNIIIYAIGMIEKNLRCYFSNFLTLKYHDSEMRKKKYYQNLIPLRTIKKVHKRIKESILKNQITDDLTIQFSNSGRIPLWVTIESFSFGELFYFYKNLNTSQDDINLNDKTQIAKNYGLSSHIFENFLYSIKFVRNICSHFNRLIGRKLISLPKSSHKIIKINSNSCELFQFIMLIVYLLEHIDNKQLSFFKKRLQVLFSNYEKVLNIIDSSTNWNLIFDNK